MCQSSYLNSTLSAGDGGGNPADVWYLHCGIVTANDVNAPGFLAVDTTQLNEVVRPF